MKAGRRTVAVATLVGALGLSVLNAPAAQAADTGITVSDIVINKGKPIVVGTSKVVEPSLTFNITLPSGYSTADPYRYDAFPFIYHGNLKTAAHRRELHRSGRIHLLRAQLQAGPLRGRPLHRSALVS